MNMTFNNNFDFSFASHFSCYGRSIIFYWFINNLKIRAGYGIVGNQEIGDVARFGLYETRYGTNLNELQPGFWQQFYNIGTAYDIAGNNTGTLPSGFVSTQAANPDLRTTLPEPPAGITVVHSIRHEAELRFNASQNNFFPEGSSLQTIPGTGLSPGLKSNILIKPLHSS